MPRPKLIVDANVLIDYFNSDFTILREVNRYVGQIHVPDRLLINELPSINLQDCQQVGIKIITPKKNISKIAEKKLVNFHLLIVLFFIWQKIQSLMSLQMILTFKRFAKVITLKSKGD